MTRAALRRCVSVMVGAALVAACTVLPDAPRKLGTCGVAMAVWVTHPAEARYEYFRIDDGTLHYGGGRDALMLKTSWSAPLSADQCGILREIAGKAGWLDPAMQSLATEKGAAEASVTVAWDGGHSQFRLPAGSPSVVAVVDFLGAITRTRFDRYLDRLPEAGKQK